MECAFRGVGLDESTVVPCEGGCPYCITRAKRPLAMSPLRAAREIDQVQWPLRGNKTPWLCSTRIPRKKHGQARTTSLLLSVFVRAVSVSSVCTVH